MLRKHWRPLAEIISSSLVHEAVRKLLIYRAQQSSFAWWWIILIYGYISYGSSHVWIQVKNLLLCLGWAEPCWEQWDPGTGAVSLTDHPAAHVSCSCTSLFWFESKTSERVQGRNTGCFWWLAGLEKFGAMLESSNKPSGFSVLHVYISDLIRACSQVPIPWQKTKSGDFFLLWLELGEHPREGSSRQGTAHEDILFFLHKHSSWCRYLGNKQSFCRPNISGLSLSWEQTVCLASCKHTESSYLVLPLQLIVI